MSSDQTTPSVERASLAGLEKTPHAEVFDHADPRTVRLQLAADERVPKHQHPDVNVVLYLVEGELELTLDSDVHDLAPGDIVRFDGGQDISPRAVEESTALVVFAPKG